MMHDDKVKTLRWEMAFLQRAAIDVQVSGVRTLNRLMRGFDTCAQPTVFTRHHQADSRSTSNVDHPRGDHMLLDRFKDNFKSSAEPCGLGDLAVHICGVR